MDFIDLKSQYGALRETINARIQKVLDHGQYIMGPEVKELEERLAALVGARHCVTVASGTEALLIALMALGIKPGDEVITPPFTFVATAEVIVLVGATPVFVDVEPDTCNLDPRLVERAITPRTRAIMPVHWAGYPCEMDELAALADRHGLWIVEDAAHALGATYRGRPIGALSRFTCFSFQAIKHVTTGDGGALCCAEPADLEAALRRRWFGIDRANSKPSLLGERVYDLEEVGYKYHLNDLGAALGLGNLEAHAARLARRQAIGAFYRSQLADLPGLCLPTLAPDRSHAYWLFPVLVERREDFIRKLKAQDIPTSVVHLSIDRYAVFGGLRDDLPGQAFYNARQVSLPIHAGLTDQDLERVVSAIKSGW